MNNSISIEYPTFTHKNSTVILKPGSQFSINELRSRLHQMDVDARNVGAKENLANLYESTLSDDRNKFKLFDRLKKDTENYYAKMGISQTQKLTMPSKDIDTERSKVINLRYASHNNNINNYEVNNNEENSRNQEIKLKKPRNKNTNVNKRNAFFSSENNEQNDDNTYKEEEIKDNKYNKHSRNFQNNESTYPDLNNNDNNNNIYYNRNDNYNYNFNNDYKKQDIEYNNNNIDIKEKNYTNNPQDYNPYDENKNININNINESNVNMNNNEENILMKSPDEESNFSFLSAFSSFKNNSKQICCHVLTGFIIICLALGILYLYRIFSESINGFFSYIFERVMHPGEIISSTFGILRNYWYIIPIILICLIIIISLLKNYKLKKRCEEIMKKIVEDLSNDEENRTISEEDIFRKYVQGYGISYKKFIKSYLPILRNLRRKNNRLKIFNEIIDGKEMMFWELNQ